MRLPIIIFVVCFGLLVCTNAKNFQSKKLENFLLFSTNNKFYTLHDPTKGAQTLNVKIKDYKNSFETYGSTVDFTFNCKNKTIYVLKAGLIHHSYDHALDVIQYKGNNKFKRINQKNNIFNRAHSIASDWTTGLLYWSETENNKKQSIKVTDESFKEPKYIINPQDDADIMKLSVYPKRGELFFSSRSGSLWYTSMKPNSTARLLFSSPPKFSNIYDFSIDYATDKLYLIAESKGIFVLYCIDIGSSARPIGVSELIRIETLATFPDQAISLVAFNNTFYWSTLESSAIIKLHFKNGNETVVDGKGLSVDSKLSFVSSSCPPSTSNRTKKKKTIQ